jgi:hypothetical protein
MPGALVVRRMVVFQSAVLAVVTVVLLALVVLTVKVDQAAENTARQTQVLLLDGKTASAKDAKQTEKNTKAGDRIIAQVEGQLSDIQRSALVNHDLICSIAETVHVTSPTIEADCR